MFLYSLFNRPPIPPDLAAHGWHWNDRGFLARDDVPVVIAWDPEMAFRLARTYEATRERGRDKGGGRKAEGGRMKPAYCHLCHKAHADWTTGAVWQCQRCLFRIPAAHVWRPDRQEETDEKPQEYAQTRMEL